MKRSLLTTLAAGAAILATGTLVAPAVAAGNPSISPSVQTKQYAINQPAQPCPTGVLCTVVVNPGGKTKTEFFISVCRTYSVSNWNGAGSYFDSQTGGVVTTFYDKNHKVLTSFRPNALPESYNWDKVYSIKSC